MKNPLCSPLVSVDWLQSNLSSTDLIILDATYAPSASALPPKSAADERQIPGTRIFDFDKTICDRNTSLPHMMPSPEEFQKEVRALGINQDSSIVVYDRIGTFSSPRAWWMLHAMGHEKVAVLDGGFPAWIAAGHSTEPLSCTPNKPQCKPGNFIAKPQTQFFCTADTVAAALNDSHCVVLDARSEGRFLGKDPEPRPGLRTGHMPNAVNLPFSMVQHNGRMRSAEDIRSVFATKITPNERLIASCGSGVTACILILAAEIIGHRNKSVYDGSWAEWGMPSDRPVVKD